MLSNGQATSKPSKVLQDHYLEIEETHGSMKPAAEMDIIWNKLLSKSNYTKAI